MTAVPPDPLSFIQRCVRERKLFWTYHVGVRLEKRHITRTEIISTVDSYEIVEAYPDDKYLPSYLVLAGNEFHILLGADVDDDNVRVVTAYRPDPAEWESDLRGRRKRS